MSYKTGRGNVAKKCLRFHAAVKMVFDYQSVTKYAVAASRQLAPEVIMVMFVSTLDAPRRGWDLWRFAALIPSGWRLPPIHKVMGDHASRGPTPAGASLPRGMFRTGRSLARSRIPPRFGGRCVSIATDMSCRSYSQNLGAVCRCR